MNGRNSNALGWLFVSIVALAYLISLSARTLFSGIAAFAAVFLSRPLALAMERGNTDEVIFLLLVLSCLLASKFPSRAQGWFIAGAAVLLACLKVYPAVTAVAALKSRWGRWLVPTAAVASAGALVITAGSRLKNVLEGTPAMVVGSFGVIPLVNAVGRATHWNAAGWIQGHRVANSVLAVVLFLFFAGIGLRFRRHLEGRLPALGAPTFRGTLAASCAAIYCFAFIGGASFNYRLIFLTGVLALLLRANDDGLYSVRPYAVTIVLYLAIPGRFIVLHEACDAAVFGFLSAWLAVMCQQAIGSKSAMEEQGLHPNFAALVEAPQR